MSEVKVIKRYGLVLNTPMESKRCGWYMVTSFEPPEQCFVKFIDTGSVVRTSVRSARRGTIRDRNTPTVFGVGCLGYGKYKSRESTHSPKTKHYQKWENMLARCYYPKTARYHAYGGVGVTVCKEWLNFQTFAEWFDANYVEDQHLDKDILGDGTIYSPESCCFVPQHINGLFVNNCKNRLKLYDTPTGVHICRGAITSSVSVKGVSDERVTFNTEEDAVAYYEKKKTQVVREAVEKSYLEGELCTKAYQKLKDYEYNSKGE